MTFTPRAAWADPANTAKLRPAGHPVPIAYVHHSGGGQQGLTLPQWARQTETAVTTHVAPGNSTPLSAIDYSELVSQNGDVCEGRGLEYEDAATLGQNQISASWCVVGNFETEQPTDAALQSLAERIGVACDLGWLVPRDQVVIRGHRDDPYFSTSCPGRNLYAQLPHVLDLVRQNAPQEKPDMEAAQITALNEAVAGIRTLIAFIGADKGPDNLPLDVTESKKLTGVNHRLDVLEAKIDAIAAKV